MRVRTGVLAVVVGVLGLGFASAWADTMNVSYFTLSESDPDVGSSYCCGYYGNEVSSTLGVGGYPVYNSGYGGPTLHDVDTNGQLLWWSPSYATPNGSGVVTIPYSNSMMYAPAATGGNDASAYQTAVFTGILHVPTSETVSFTMSSDDDSFLAIGDDVIGQNGGVHGTEGNTFDDMLASGNYLLTLFYADRDQVGAVLNFSIDTAGVTVTATPLPTT